MRINVYSQERTDEVKVIEKKSNTGLIMDQTVAALAEINAAHVELLTAIVEMRAAESSEGRPKSWPIAHIGSREWQIRVRKAYSRLSEAITNSQRIVAKYEGVNG